MIKGVYLSHKQKNVQWDKLKEQGINFALIRATQGRSATHSDRVLSTDTQMKKHIRQAIAHDIPFGLYHCFTARTIEEVEVECKYFLQTIKEYRYALQGYVAISFDFSGSMELCGDIPFMTLTDLVNRFLTLIRDAGYTPLLYFSMEWYKHFALPLFMEWDVGVRDYSLFAPTNIPRLKLWSYGIESIEREAYIVSHGYFDPKTFGSTVAPQYIVDPINQYDFVRIRKGARWFNGVRVDEAEIRNPKERVVLELSPNNILALLDNSDVWIETKYLYKVDKDII